MQRFIIHAVTDVNIRFGQIVDIGIGIAKGGRIKRLHFRRVGVRERIGHIGNRINKFIDFLLGRHMSGRILIIGVGRLRIVPGRFCKQCLRLGSRRSSGLFLTRFSRVRRLSSHQESGNGDKHYDQPGQQPDQPVPFGFNG